MSTFVDPRDDPRPATSIAQARTTADPAELAELTRLCREGRLYDVERWIRSGRPLQLAGDVRPTRRRAVSALEAALDAEDHALVLLLLCNGYDANLERFCSLDFTLRARRWDLLNLLLIWGANPHDVDLEELFDTYDSKLWERFRKLGVVLTEGHALASALAHHTSNKPLFGFAKRHREADPKIQLELNIALGHHSERGSEKGVLLCLWAGADPHAPAPDLRDLRQGCDDEEEEGGGFLGFTPIWRACLRGDAEILRRLGPDPELDDFDELYRFARSAAVVDLLAEKMPPGQVGTILQTHLWPLTNEYGRWGSMHTLERIFILGGRWKEASSDAIAGVRRLLLKLEDRSFVEVMKLFATNDYCSREVLVELARTLAMRNRMQKVGFIPAPPSASSRYEQYRPTRSREVLAKCGVEVPKRERFIPRLIEIGGRGPDRQEVRMGRADLYDAVWSTPVATLAEEWGISGPGLAKACRRIKVPLPPRGYWAKRTAGRRVRRPPLPALRPGEAEQIIVWAPAEDFDGDLAE